MAMQDPAAAVLSAEAYRRRPGRAMCSTGRQSRRACGDEQLARCATMKIR